MYIVCGINLDFTRHTTKKKGFHRTQHFHRVDAYTRCFCDFIAGFAHHSNLHVHGLGASWPAAANAYALHHIKDFARTGIFDAHVAFHPPKHNARFQNTLCKQFTRYCEFVAYYTHTQLLLVKHMHYVLPTFASSMHLSSSSKLVHLLARSRVSGFSSSVKPCRSNTSSMRLAKRWSASFFSCSNCDW